MPFALVAFAVLCPVKAGQKLNETIRYTLFDDIVVQRAELFAYLRLYVPPKSSWGGQRRLGMLAGSAEHTLSAFHLAYAGGHPTERRRVELRRNVRRRKIFHFRKIA